MCICMYICIIYRTLNINIWMPHASISVVRLIMTISNIKGKMEKKRKRNKGKKTIYNTKKNTKITTVYRLLFWEVIYFFPSPCIIITSSCIVLVVTYTIVFLHVVLYIYIHAFKMLDTRKNRGVASEFKTRKEKRKGRKDGKIRCDIKSKVIYRRLLEGWER